jgi:hypothetical protein
MNEHFFSVFDKERVAQIVQKGIKRPVSEKQE